MKNKQGALAIQALTSEDWEEIDACIPKELFEKVNQSDDPTLNHSDWHKIYVCVHEKLSRVRSGFYGNDRVAKDWKEHLKEIASKLREALPGVTTRSKEKSS